MVVVLHPHQMQWLHCRGSVTAASCVKS